ncbi:MAG: TraX family protein, partial [Halarsenatibacteraceae bacterium]
MSSFQIKMVAITTMLIDHIGSIIFPEYIILRVIGRLAFPLFAFLITEGYRHTSNINRYLVRLSIFALISQYPFWLAFGFN